MSEIKNGLVYLSHAITFNSDSQGRAVEPKTIERLADLLTEAGMRPFRPLMHNPWNGYELTPPVDVSFIRGREWNNLVKLRKQRYPRVSTLRYELPDIKQAYIDTFENGDGLGAEYIVDTDLAIINQSLMVVALLNPPSIGGAMEILHATRMGIPVIGVVDNFEVGENMPRVSRWAIEHCTHVYASHHITARMLAQIQKTLA